MVLKSYTILSFAVPKKNKIKKSTSAALLGILYVWEFICKSKYTHKTVYCWHDFSFCNMKTILAFTFEPQTTPFSMNLKPYKGITCKKKPTRGSHAVTIHVALLWLQRHVKCNMGHKRWLSKLLGPILIQIWVHYVK